MAAKVGDPVIITDFLHPNRGRQGFVVAKHGIRFKYQVRLVPEDIVVACAQVRKIKLQALPR